MKTHDLKTWPEFFEAILLGTKTFDIRKNDRDFHVGDRLLLHEYDPTTKKYTDRFVEKRITYILENRSGAGCAADFGLNDGYAILAIAD